MFSIFVLFDNAVWANRCVRPKKTTAQKRADTPVCPYKIREKQDHKRGKTVGANRCVRPKKNNRGFPPAEVMLKENPALSK